MDADFEQLIDCVRVGDADAAAALVHQFESAVRIAVRARLFDPDMRRQFDSMDVCQSVLSSFFVRVAAGQFDLHRPSQLVALLTKMAHNKIAWRIRYYHRQCRDIRRDKPESNALMELSSRENDPASELQVKELLEQAWQMMSLELREIAFRRREGQSWAQIATAIGGTARGRQRQFERGLDAIVQQLGIDEAAHHESQ